MDDVKPLFSHVKEVCRESPLIFLRAAILTQTLIYAEPLQKDIPFVPHYSRASLDAI